MATGHASRGECRITEPCGGTAPVERRFHFCCPRLASGRGSGGHAQIGPRTAIRRLRVGHTRVTRGLTRRSSQRLGTTRTASVQNRRRMRAADEPRVSLSERHAAKMRSEAAQRARGTARRRVPLMRTADECECRTGGRAVHAASAARAAHPPQEAAGATSSPYPSASGQRRLDCPALWPSPREKRRRLAATSVAHSTRSSHRA